MFGGELRNSSGWIWEIMAVILEDKESWYRVYEYRINKLGRVPEKVLCDEEDGVEPYGELSGYSL